MSESFHDREEKSEPGDEQAVELQPDERRAGDDQQAEYALQRQRMAGQRPHPLGRHAPAMDQAQHRDGRAKRIQGDQRRSPLRLARLYDQGQDRGQHRACARPSTKPPPCPAG